MLTVHGDEAGADRVEDEIRERLQVLEVGLLGLQFFVPLFS